MPEKKYLDIEGVKTLYRELSLQDYPNNDLLTAVINAIDAAKADKEHSHTVTDVTDLQIILDEYVAKKVHNHDGIYYKKLMVDNKDKAINKKINNISKTITEQNIDTAFNDIFGGE